MYLRLLSTNKLLKTQNNTQNINLCALPGFESATPKIVEHSTLFITIWTNYPNRTTWNTHHTCLDRPFFVLMAASFSLNELSALFIFSCQAITKVLTSKTINMSVWSLLDGGPSNYSLMFIILFTQNTTYLYYTSLLILIRIKNTAH